MSRLVIVSNRVTIPEPGSEILSRIMQINSLTALLQYVFNDPAATTPPSWATFDLKPSQISRNVNDPNFYYGALAAKLGFPKAVRAVGHANGANPISVVVPCHRLIGASGSLIKYGGGIERKRWLLAHEGVTLACVSETTRQVRKSPDQWPRSS